MTTYSVATTGYRPQNPFAIKTLTLPDASVGSQSAAGPFSCQQGIMRRGDTIMVKTQTGAIRNYKIDAERSVPGYIVLLPQ